MSLGGVISMIFKTEFGWFISQTNAESRSFLTLGPEGILAWEVDESPLTPETGFPLRLIDFGLFNYKCVKSIREIQVTRKNMLGYWEAHSGYDLDGTVQSKKYYAVDLHKKFWFGGTGEVLDKDI